MTEEREPDGFKIAAEQNIISGRFNARTTAQRNPDLQKHHRTMMTAVHNGVLATFSAMPLAVQKAVVNWHDSDPATEGKTALIKAACSNHVEIVKHLLEIGADVSMVDDEGNSAVSCAAGWGNRAVLQILLDAGGNLNHRTTRGWMPLMEAVTNGKAETAQLLLERGAETRAPLPCGGSIKARAVRDGHHNIAVLIDTEERKRGAAVAAKLMEKGTAETITVSRPLKLKPR